MAKRDEPYQYVLVESFKTDNTSGLRGDVHIRPCEGQGHDPSLHVECSKELVRNYPVGTRFKIRAKLTDRMGGGEYLYSSYRWPYEVISKP